MANVSGNNGYNYYWHKMSNGTMLQWKRNEVIGTALAGQNYDKQLAFAVNYIDDNVTVVCNVSGDTFTPVNEITGPNIIVIARDHFTIRVMNKYSTNLSVKVSWFAIGRYK